MKEMCHTEMPYHCPNCGNDMLFFVQNDSYRVIDYKRLFDHCKDITGYLKSKDLSVLECGICNKRYIIDWRGRYPKPLIAGRVSLFKKK